jgi:uncharacterized protein
MAGTFEVYTDKAGKFRFRLKASNGQVVATGEAYGTQGRSRERLRGPAMSRKRPLHLPARSRSSGPVAGRVWDASRPTSEVKTRH